MRNKGVAPSAAGKYWVATDNNIYSFYLAEDGMRLITQWDSLSGVRMRTAPQANAISVDLCV
ncbi:MAG: hypothetical protein IPG58_01485 [Acidobacteria bacterium]|nr:hypothetical protein [Acidobacteriota bacterium]